MKVSMTDEAVGAVISALAFCLSGVEIFVNEDGDDDADQIEAATQLLARLARRRANSNE